MKYVYVVKGSEDGIIGVYGSKKKAIAAGVAYYCAGNDVASEAADVRKIDDGFIIIGGESRWANAEIERFIME